MESDSCRMQIGRLLEQLQQHAQEEKDKVKSEASQQVADELLALQSIYGNESLTLLQYSTAPGARSGEEEDVDDSIVAASSYRWESQAPLRLKVIVPLDGDGEAPTTDSENEFSTPINLSLSATLPVAYPQSSTAPQLQLLNRYIGAHGVDHTIFGQVLRLFHHDHGDESKGSGGMGKVLFVPGEVILFDGIEKVRENVKEWYEKREEDRKCQDRLHRPRPAAASAKKDDSAEDCRIREDEEKTTAYTAKADTVFKHHISITSSQPLTERKSVFVGHAAVLEDVSQVPSIIANLLQDKKIARATHPAIYAWVCRPKGSSSAALQRDHDDDGESAAGGRLAHLLDLLHLENVIVIVTRWYGGVQLGADRFKLINRAAREALETARLTSPSQVK